MQTLYKELIKLKNLPLVSIIMCTYNRAKYMEACINSVFKQSNQQWELIIVDDGSDDNTFEIVNRYLNFPNIRYIKHKNIKQARSRNIGLLVSSGDFITFIDSDDTYQENHIQSRLDFMMQNVNIDLIQGGVKFSEEVFVADYYKPGNKINVKECVLGATFFGKRKVFFELNGFNDLHYGEDTDLWESAEKKFNVHWLREPETYVYTRAEDSISKKETKKIDESSTNG